MLARAVQRLVGPRLLDLAPVRDRGEQPFVVEPADRAADDVPPVQRADRRPAVLLPARGGPLDVRQTTSRRPG